VIHSKIRYVPLYVHHATKDPLKERNKVPSIGPKVFHKTWSFDESVTKKMKNVMRNFFNEIISKNLKLNSKGNS